MIEGLQDCEKIRILREELQTRGNQAKLDKLNKLISRFTPEGLSETQQDPSEMVREIHNLLNNM